MCGIRYFICLILAIFATTVTAQNSTSQVCTQSPVMEARALNVTKCYQDMFTATLLKDTVGLSCKSFDDFNAMYTKFWKDVMKTCFNATNAELTEAQKTFLDMVNAVLSFNKLNATNCLVDVIPKIQECGNQNLTERNYTETWIRRSHVDFTIYACDKIPDNMNCTINAVRENCKSEYKQEVTALVSSLYDIALKHCNTTTDTTGTGSSSNFSPFPHMILIITAFSLIAKS